MFESTRRLLLKCCLIAALNSYVLTTISAEKPLQSLTGGGPDNCSNCTTSPKNFYECYHVGEFDPCSTLTCMTDTLVCPQCDPTPSVNNCKTREHFFGINGTQYLSDVGCSTTDPGGYHEGDDLGDDCTGKCKPMEVRCTLDGCGSGSQYGAAFRSSSDADDCDFS